MSYSFNEQGDTYGNGSNNDNWWLLVVLLVAIAAGVVVVVANVTLFEDGSIQFLGRLGWGFCLVWW